jgi:exopolyphosphatase/guanosine-5'-triphosphate,3'-diphosphate pyrophosphatase
MKSAEHLDIDELLAFATSAIREAKNSDEVISHVNKVCNIDLQVLSGDEEARFTFLAARRWLGWSSGDLLVLDIGGGSLEIARGAEEDPTFKTSMQLGAGRLTRQFLKGDPFTSKSLKALEEHHFPHLKKIMRQELVRLSGPWQNFHRTSIQNLVNTSLSTLSMS